MASPTLLEKFMKGAGLSKLTCSESSWGMAQETDPDLKNGSLCVLVRGCWGLFCLGFVWVFFKLGLWIIGTQILDVGPGSKFFETFCQNLKSGGTYG